MGLIKGDLLEYQHIVEMQAHRLEAVHGKAFTDVMRGFTRRLNGGK